MIRCFILKGTHVLMRTILASSPSGPLLNVLPPEASLPFSRENLQHSSTVIDVIIRVWDQRSAKTLLQSLTQRAINLRNSLKTGKTPGKSTEKVRKSWRQIVRANIIDRSDYYYYDYYFRTLRAPPQHMWILTTFCTRVRSGENCDV